ncbi:mannitol operon transcriptional antiterminator [Dethiosulfatibacter aminovorans DSM 17477]|uniref:Mannitol operon transcriptional antiterminator n=1 Tax=Dethiosulfatibacter aminovorans DSM 17477 TaxID=1121476 RepID=A0A1M6GC20_9FIRM|nr:BglG family transcription antiterminator [Dethiosulfatibacter aminovorans]SHJ07481.1 mannitol operon transcriptional antiterminator [Dethiosulfatibacter aminovorans DSM 17477]
MLNSRMKKTLIIILEAEGYVTMQSIADKLNVSKRTLLREVDSIQKWVEYNGGTFVKKKGSGIEITGDDDEKNRLLGLLKSEKSDLIFTSFERGSVIKSELLKTEEPMKLFYFGRLLDVTESTISNDIAGIEDWFNSYGIEIIKRPGLGIILSGKEKDKRKAIVSLVLEQIKPLEFMDYFKENKFREINATAVKERINKSILELLSLESLETVLCLVRNIEDEMGYAYSDNAFVSLVVRTAVMLKRRFIWGQQLIDYEKREKIRRDKIFKILVKWINENPSEYYEDIPEEELLYLTMYIKGAKLRYTKIDNKISMIEDFQTIKLVKEFIQGVEEETGIYLSDNELLTFSLIKHLRPSIYRMKMDLDIINPLLNVIKETYPKLFLAISKCIYIIEERENIKVPEDEIAYLTAHIGAIIQKENKDIVKKYQVVLACTYGIGASQLLRANVEKNFNNIEIVKVVSIMDYKLGRVDFEGVDIIISTVSLEDSEVPHIVVNPVLKPEDILSVSTFLKAYTPKAATGSIKKKRYLADKLKTLDEYSRIIRRILKNYSYEKNFKAGSMKEIIDYSSSLIGRNPEEVDILIKAFAEREEKGTTILSKKGMLLLHCRADISMEVCLKILSLSNPIELKQGDEQLIDTIVIMVGPVVINQKILDTMSEITRSIIASDFSELILSKREEEIEFELNRILDKYYENQVYNL